MKKSVAALVLGLFAVGANANDLAVGHCKEYNWKSGDIIPVEAQMFKTSSIKLPEDAFDVVWGSKGLWDTDYAKNYLFIKPLTTKEAGLSTTITVVGKSGNSYEFLVKRVAKMESHCVAVLANGDLINKTAWRDSSNQEQQNYAALNSRIAQLQQENAVINANAKKEAERKASEAIKIYQAAVNSNYEWSKSSGWYAASGTVVESVHDDGRFTYIRLKSDARGLMEVSGEINGKKEVLESTYISETHTYKVSGIFPKLLLRADESDLVITRKGA